MSFAESSKLFKCKNESSESLHQGFVGGRGGGGGARLMCAFDSFVDRLLLLVYFCFIFLNVYAIKI